MAAELCGMRCRPAEHCLAPTFVEHLMGLEPGWVTGLSLPRTAQLRVLGNGVVPLQAAHAVTLLLADFAALFGDTADECCASEWEAYAA
jgi:DNA (cytosine-5)-methyltransferase 1